MFTHTYIAHMNYSATEMKTFLVEIIGIVITKYFPTPTPMIKLMMLNNHDTCMFLNNLTVLMVILPVSKQLNFFL